MKYIFLFLVNIYAWEQAVNLKYFGLTFHPGGGNATEDYQYPNAIDEDGYWVYQLGGEVDYELQSPTKWWSLRGTVALFQDCIEAWSGHLSLGLRLKHRFKNGFGLDFGIGPTLIWRENWWKKQEVSDWYNGDGFYGKKETNATFQKTLLWYGGNLGLSYMFNEKFGIQYSVIPGYPQVITSSLGLRILL
jgi:hypothetical protein